MAKAEQDLPWTQAGSPVPSTNTALRLPRAVQYAIALALVAAAVFLAFVASSVVPAAGLTLIFVLPVVISGTAFGLGPSLTATVASVLAFDFFFTEPYLTLRMTDPADIWAAGLLLVTAAIVSTVSWQVRQYALDARRAAAQAEELRLLAHVVLQGASQPQIVDAAAAALCRIFAGPAAVYGQADGLLRVEATAGDAKLSDAEKEAARSALESGVHLRGETYPHDRSRFDMWPVTSAPERDYVLAVDFSRAVYDRPADVDRLVEIVAAYLVANSGPRGG